jgi:hypothetical protein
VTRRQIKVTAEPRALGPLPVGFRLAVLEGKAEIGLSAGESLYPGLGCEAVAARGRRGRLPYWAQACSRGMSVAAHAVREGPQWRTVGPPPFSRIYGGALPDLRHTGGKARTAIGRGAATVNPLPWLLIGTSWRSQVRRQGLPQTGFFHSVGSLLAPPLS